MICSKLSELVFIFSEPSLVESKIFSGIKESVQIMTSAIFIFLNAFKVNNSGSPGPTPIKDICYPFFLFFPLYVLNLKKNIPINPEENRKILIN